MDEVLKKIMLILVSASLFITSILSISLVVYVVGWNYIIIPTYNSSVTALNQSGYIDASDIAAAEDVIATLPKFYEYMDYIFLFMFSIFALGLPFMAYKSNREGYGSLLGYVTIGNMILLFFTGLSIQVSEWIYENLVERLIPTLSNTMPLYSIYIDNCGLINLILFAVCIFANFIDFDEFSFSIRKKPSQNLYDQGGSSGGDEVV